MYRREWLAALAGSFTPCRIHAQQGARPVPDRPRGDREDERYMRRAIELAHKSPQNPFGALLVNKAEGRIVGEGWNRSAQNPTWHGEMGAINKCAASHRGIDWTALTLYTTAEPCAMCQAAICWAGIGVVIYGSSIPFLQGLSWWAIDIRAEEIARRAAFRKCTVIGGLLENECNALFLAARNSRPLPPSK